MIGRKIKKVINTPVMMGVVRIWTLSRRGPPVGMVELDRPDEEDDGREADDEEEGRKGKGRSCRLSIGWVPVKSIMWEELGTGIVDRSGLQYNHLQGVMQTYRAPLKLPVER
jgi:hypothetical protein